MPSDLSLVPIHRDAMTHHITLLDTGSPRSSDDNANSNQITNDTGRGWMDLHMEKII